jgi:anti-sigma factor RsiW
MTADPYARLDAAYLLGALDAEDHLAYEAHLAICPRCRAGLAEISASPSLLAGLDESVFAAPPEVAPTPVPDTLLPRLLQAAGRERARRRWLDLGSWRLTPGPRVIVTSGTALTETQIKNLQITQPTGPAILALG